MHVRQICRRGYLYPIATMLLVLVCFVRSDARAAIILESASQRLVFSPLASPDAASDPFNFAVSFGDGSGGTAPIVATLGPVTLEPSAVGNIFWFDDAAAISAVTDGDNDRIYFGNWFPDQSARLTSASTVENNLYASSALNNTPVQSIGVRLDSLGPFEFNGNTLREWNISLVFSDELEGQSRTVPAPAGIVLLLAGWAAFRVRRL